MLAIYRKEIKQYFNSIMGYVFLSMFLLICGWFFTMGNLASQNSDIKTFFGSILVIIMFLIPIITMRSFSEEKKIRTEQLLLTSPVSLPAIVIGKYLAALTIFGLGLSVTLTYPIIIAYFGTFDPLVTLGNYLGIIVAVAAFIAIGIFISALTENQVVAAVVSYCVLMGLWMVGLLRANQTGFIRAVIDFISFNYKFDEFTMGIFNPSSIIYYLSISGIFLFLTVRMLEQRRWN
jgi:ABC-2 type transport system permease protein